MFWFQLAWAQPSDPDFSDQWIELEPGVFVTCGVRNLEGVDEQIESCLKHGYHSPPWFHGPATAQQWAEACEFGIFDEFFDYY